MAEKQPANNDLPAITRLHYQKGETIVKKGDYGISIYHIVAGEAEVVDESQHPAAVLARLGPGEVIGEVVFVSGYTTPRSATVRARKETQVEVWHPSRIRGDYEAMPSMIKYISNHMIRRILRTRRLLTEINALEGSQKKRRRPKALTAAKRKTYRKKVNIECTYAPQDAPGMHPLKGIVIDLSRTGMLMEIDKSNLSVCSHHPDKRFAATAYLPSGKQLDVQFEVKRSEETGQGAKLLLGIGFVHLSEAANKILGFYLMPTSSEAPK